MDRGLDDEAIAELLHEQRPHCGFADFFFRVRVRHYEDLPPQPQRLLDQLAADRPLCEAIAERLVWTELRALTVAGRYGREETARLIARLKQDDLPGGSQAAARLSAAQRYLDLAEEQAFDPDWAPVLEAALGRVGDEPCVPTVERLAELRAELHLRAPDLLAEVEPWLQNPVDP